MADTPLHIAIDCRLMHYRRSGTSNYTRRLAQALAALPAAPSISVLLDKRDDDTDWVPATVRVVRTRTPAHHPHEALALAIELRGQSLIRAIDVLHSPDFITCRGAFRKVITVHDLYFMEHPEVMGEDGARYYARVAWSAQLADRIIAVSQATAADIGRLLPGSAGKVTMIHEAADPLVAESTFLKPPAAPYVLFVGTFEPRKNLSTLLRALARTSDEVRLVIVGEAGWIESEPSMLVRQLGLSKRVHLAGRVGDPELDVLYRHARMLAAPSLSEGFGLTVLEAMARGTPVVCSDSGALPEVAGDAALMHNPTDAAALAECIMQVWHDPARQARMRAASLARSAAFSWERAARETLAVYRQV